MSNWEICEWIVFTLGMVVLAIPATRAINRVIKACGDHTRKYAMDKNTENQEDLETKGKYKAVSYITTSPAEHEATKFIPKPTNSMARIQEELDKKIKHLEKDRISKNKD